MNDMCNRLMQLPNEISDLQLEILDLNDAVNATQAKIQVSESKIKSDINNAVDANGKKVYSNEDARKAAFIEDAANDPELSSLNETLSNQNSHIQTKRILVEALNSEQRNIRVLLNFFTNNVEISDQL